MSMSMFITAVTVQIISRCQFGGIVVGKNSNLEGWQTEVCPIWRCCRSAIVITQRARCLRALVFVPTRHKKRSALKALARL